MMMMGKKQHLVGFESDEESAVFLSDDESDDFDGSENQPAEAGRDEIHEVKKQASADTFRVRVGRTVMTVVLLITAFTVTSTTYEYASKEQEKDFVTAFEQFSRTVANAATDQQRSIREHLSAFSDSMSAAAVNENATWPFFTMPFYAVHAEHYIAATGAEILTVGNMVTAPLRNDWETYAAANYEEWVADGHLTRHGNLDRLNPVGYKTSISAPGPDGPGPDKNRTVYYPHWNWAPAPNTYGITNMNFQAIPDFGPIIDAINELRNETLVTRVRGYQKAALTTFTVEEHDALHDKLPEGESEYPHSSVFTPVYEGVRNPQSPIVAVLGSSIAWDRSLRDLVPSNVVGIVTEIWNTCNQTYTYEINGGDADFVGTGSFHEAQFTDMMVEVDLAEYNHPKATSTPGHCVYTMRIYPSSKFKKTYYSKTPEIFATVIALVFIAVAVVFFTYDILVHMRNKKLIANAALSNAVVTSLFPGDLREKVMNVSTKKDDPTRKNQQHCLVETDNSGLACSKPIADLILNTSVIFADIVGFTSWSSVREPHQVFTLLERVFGYFDGVAKYRRIFKVETVGDCYVAAAGVPKPRRDHAIAMARFARDIMTGVQKVFKTSEVILGPGTGELSLRIGLHSGPVTAGVMRGERSRYQLFGDTMNTCARVESTSKSGRIQMSAEYARLLQLGGKGNWISRREDLVQAKGKGEMETYWLKTRFRGKNKDTDSVASCISESSDNEDDQPNTSSSSDNVYSSDSDRVERLVEWNVDVLAKLIKQIATTRAATSVPTVDTYMSSKSDRLATQALEEVCEIIRLPEFKETKQVVLHKEEEDLPQEVSIQLRTYVHAIAAMYRPNAFHNFDHANHVILSTVKLLSRIVAPTNVHFEDVAATKKSGKSLHDHTYGITSDPLTQFACVFSALIHDVDHTGVPNTQLIKEDTAIAKLYKSRSVAEQNSLDMAWNLLMENRFAILRTAIYTTEAEFRRFRQLVVNSVMATDICDKDLKALRNERWEKAFDKSQNEQVVLEDERTSVNRKATIVIEHLIQASDVSHTMQHWHIYRKWNECLFMENYEAYKSGRSSEDPSIGWYEGEIGFFDFYVIPLAKKLKECGVFGVSSDEYLIYAMQNRREWEQKGQQVVAEMLERVCHRNLAFEAEQRTEKSKHIEQARGEAHSQTLSTAMM